MKRFIKWTFLVGPLLFWLFLLCSWTLDKQRIDERFRDADGLVLSTGAEKLQFHLLENREGEKTHFSIRLAGPDNSVKRQWAFTVDRDMYGGGFVSAIDLDEDGDPEVLAWGAHERGKAFYIDVAAGAVASRPYEQIPQPVRELAVKWHQAHIMRPAEITLLSAIILCYYMSIGLMVLAVRAVRRMKSGIN